MAVVGVACSSDVEDPSTTTSIVGRITDDSGSPIEAARVSTIPPTSTVLTDANGDFRIDGVAFGESYVVAAEKDGFRRATAVVIPSGADPNRVEIALDVQEVCVPGARRCVQGGVQAVEVCNANGNAYDLMTTCEDGEICDSVDPACKGAAVLTVSVSDFGVVRSTPAGINCGQSCERSFPSGTMVTLEAIPLARGSFVGWGEACADAGAAETCTVTMSAARRVTADFTASAFPVVVRRVGPGAANGRVRSMPFKIDCGALCQADFDRDTSVTLNAEVNSNAEFERWERDCSSAGSNPTCTLTVTRAYDVRARFRTPTFALTINKIGNGAGVVTSSPDGVDCGGNCTDDFERGTSVTLTATPDPASTFEGWSGGGCPANTSPCTITMDQDRTVSAQFDGVTFPLTVTRLGGGDGRVTSSPAGIDCGGSCQARFGPNTMVTLTAAPNSASGFSGWENDCAPAGTAADCVVTLSAARSVGARFDPFYLFPLPADVDCEVRMAFDGADPLAHSCGAGNAATVTGAYRQATARTTALGIAYMPDDATPTGGVDTGRAMPTPPAATIELTVRRDGTAFDGSGRAILVSDVDAANPVDGLRLLALDDGSVAIQAWQGGGITATATAANALPAGQWAHISATVSTTQGLEVFVDGQSRAVVSGAVAWTASSSTAWVGAERQGASVARHRLNGAFDEVRLSQGARY